MTEHDDIWVEVEVLKGGLVSMYRGRMSRVDFERWQQGTVERGAIALHDCYWSYDEGDGNEAWVVVGATPGPYANAQGTTWLRADLVPVIIPLRDGHERETHLVRPIGGAARDDVY